MSAPTPTLFGEAWVAEYFAEVDRMDSDGLLRWYAADARFRFGNAPLAKGKAAIAEVLRSFYNSIRSMRHRRTGCWTGPESDVWKAEVTLVTNVGAGSAALRDPSAKGWITALRRKMRSLVQ